MPAQPPLTWKTARAPLRPGSGEEGQERGGWGRREPPDTARTRRIWGMDPSARSSSTWLPAGRPQLCLWPVQCDTPSSLGSPRQSTRRWPGQQRRSTAQHGEQVQDEWGSLAWAVGRISTAPAARGVRHGVSIQDPGRFAPQCSVLRAPPSPWRRTGPSETGPRAGPGTAGPQKSAAAAAARLAFLSFGAESDQE